MKGSTFKYSTQWYEMNHLRQTAHLQQELMNGTYKPTPGRKFKFSERGKTRYITSNCMDDKTVNHVLCDKVLMPAVKPHLCYDNGASQKGKGVSFARKRLEIHLHEYFARYGNTGSILLMDFSGYYANIDHRKCKRILNQLIHPDQLTQTLIDRIFETFELDVSYLPDGEIEILYHTKVNPMMNMDVPEELLTGTKMLKKGVDIGNQLSQIIGIAFPYLIDNYIKIVCGMKFSGRYTDDSYVIYPSKAVLKQVLNVVMKIADDLGLIINRSKTRICDVSSFFRYMQVGYKLLDTGRLVRKINPKSITRERRKLKAYRRLLDDHRIDYPTVENSFKSWIASHYKLMSHRQVWNMANLYYDLFGKKVKWKRKHSRLNWLMEHSWKMSLSTATATSSGVPLVMKSCQMTI